MTTKTRPSDTRRRSSAFVLLLAAICRRFPDLRDWLVHDFVRSSVTRSNFLSLVERGPVSDEQLSDGFADLAGESGSWAEEKRRLRTKFSSGAPTLYGGLTW